MAVTARGFFPPPAGGRTALRPLARLGVILAVLSVLVGLQFVLFRARIPPPDPLARLARFDGVVVFTGGPGRIAHGLALLKSGHTRQLLVSGVHARVGPDTFARTFRVDADLIACCITLDHAARNTVGNAREAVKWAERLRLARVGVVSAAWHLPRSMLEVERQRRALGIDTRFVPLAVPGESREGTLRRGWMMLRESVKYWLACARAAFDDRQADFPPSEKASEE